MRARKIAVLTSGGDCPGMNATISIIVRVATQRNIRVVGVNNGYKGLYGADFVNLTVDSIKNIYSLGGTILKTARYEEFKREQVVEESAKHLKDNDIDALIVIGGNGTMNGAIDLVKKGVKVIVIPATIDNDLPYTERSLGFDSAVNSSCRYIENVQQTMEALSRGVVFEVMGRYCGDIALYSAVSTASDIIAVPEKPIDEGEIIKRAKECLAKKHKSPTIVIAEKMFDVRELAQKLTEETGVDFKYSVVGYIQRGGSPTVADKALSVQFAVRAIDLLEKGITNRAIGVSNDKIFDVSLEEAINCEENFNYELLSIFYQLNN